MSECSLAVRLFCSVWLLVAAHATTNVVRETLLAVALVEHGGVRVDPYVGTNPDLFEIPGRGAYINSNPGASLLAAAPYAVVHPLLEALYRARPALVAPKPPAAYDDPRPNRSLFMNAMRAKGVDVRLGLASLVVTWTLMAPLAALAAVALFRFLAARLADRRSALGLAMLYAVGTPILFRSAFLNQNALLAHCVLFACLALGWSAPDGAGDRRRRWLAAGALFGLGLLLDYSAAPLALVFALWALVEGRAAAGVREALARAAAFALGALPPVALLLAYQAAAFGSPWFPAQRYMPPTEFSVLGWNGMTWPDVELLWRHFADPRYGLFVYSPLLALALLAPWLPRTGPGPGRRERRALLAAAGALWLFSSANQFAHLQWNTGVRYLVPAAPLLFLPLVPVLRALSRRALALVVAPTLVVSWAVTATREDVPTALRLLATEGPTLPIFVVLRKTAGAYAPWLAAGLQPWGALAVAAIALALVAIWWTPWRAAQRAGGGDAASAAASSGPPTTR